MVCQSPVALEQSSNPEDLMQNLAIADKSINVEDAPTEESVEDMSNHPVHELNADSELVKEFISVFEEESLRRLHTRDAGDDILTPGQWSLGPAKKGMQVYYSEIEDSKWYSLRTVSSRIEGSLEDAVRILTDKDMVPKYDDNTAKVQVLEKLSQDTEIRLVSAKSVMFTTARDFCVATTTREQPDGRVFIATRSVDHPEARGRKGYVRALSMISGYIVKPLEGNACEVTVMAHFDLGGYLPKPVMKFLGFSAPLSLLQKVKDIVEA